jgi:hypothetical protein
VDTPIAEPTPEFRRELLATLAAMEQRILERIDERIAETRRYVDDQAAETRRSIDEQGAETRRYVDERSSETRRNVDAQAVETRRHFDVVAEGLLVKLELVAEGVRENNERLDRLRVEVRAELARVDRRLLRLESAGSRRRRG